MSKERNGDHDAPGQAPQQPDQPLDPRRALALADRIKPLLEGEDPGIIGAALIEVVSMFVVSHAPQIREEAFDHFIATVREMIPVHHRIMFGIRDPWNKPDDR